MHMAAIVEAELQLPPMAPDVVLGQGTKGDGVVIVESRWVFGFHGFCTFFFFLLFLLVHTLILGFLCVAWVPVEWWSPEDARGMAGRMQGARDCSRGWWPVGCPLVQGTHPINSGLVCFMEWVFVACRGFWVPFYYCYVFEIAWCFWHKLSMGFPCSMSLWV